MAAVEAAMERHARPAQSASPSLLNMVAMNMTPQGVADARRHGPIPHPMRPPMDRVFPGPIPGFPPEQQHPMPPPPKFPPRMGPGPAQPVPPDSQAGPYPDPYGTMPQPDPAVMQRLLELQQRLQAMQVGAGA